MNQTENTLAATPAAKALDATFLEARCRILDVAAILDRIGRGEGAKSIEKDPRLAKIALALEVLKDQNGCKAERIQRIFSIEYDPSWERPTPRL